MYYNKWNSSNVEHRLKQHASQVLNISLTKITIHVWKHVGLLAGFWIKKKVPRHIPTTYITNPMWGVLEKLLTHQRKYYRVSWLCGRSWGENSFACTNEGVFMVKGETNPCVCLNTIIIVWLPWLFVQQVGLLDFHVTLHWYKIWPTIEMWMTWLDVSVLIQSCCY